MLIATCWIGSLLAFMSTNLLFFNLEQFFTNLFELRKGNIRESSFLFFLLCLFFIVLLITGIRHQYKTYRRKSSIVRFSEIERHQDLYKSLTEV